MNNPAAPSNQHAETITVAVSKPVGAVNSRTAVTLAAITSTVFVSTDPGVTVATGLPIIPGMQPFTLCQCHGGDWVKKQLFALVAVGTGTLVVVESFEKYPPEGASNA